MGVYIIGEAGVNHNGSLKLAKELCQVAKDSGVDAVKFQTWKTENIVTRSVDMATYQENNVADLNESQFQMLKKLELKYADFIELKNYCDLIGIRFLSTPDDEESLDFLVSLNLDFLKIGSGEVTNIPYLRKIGAKKQSVVLSTGMSTLGDVERAYLTLKDVGAKDITLLHCTTNYPCPMNEVNLRAIQTLKDAFKCKVGYSDHTMGIEIPIAAVAMGAEIIEKHFTLDRNMEGPDHKASLNPEELTAMVKAIRHIEKAMGDGIKQPNKSEKEISQVVLKRIVAKTLIREGDILSEANMTVKRSSEGIPSQYWDLFIGLKAVQDYEVDDAIKLTTYEF
ncbi:MAG: N-acetylneuraminate synthase [Odoribacter sp.]